MKTYLTAKENSPQLVAACIAEMLTAYRRTGGPAPAELLVHPLTRPRLDNAAVRRLLAEANVRLNVREAVEPEALCLRPANRVYA